jgi:rod shape-determining protein MreD
MIIEAGKNILRFLFFILLQVTIIRHLDLGIYFNPFVFVGAILMLPIRINRTQALFIAFFTGLIIDMFYNTMGMNAAACTFMAFCRPSVLRFYSPAGDYNADATATVSSMGIRWMLSYAGTLIFLHHLVLFYLEMFSFHDFFTTLLKVILSGIASLILLLITQSLLFRNAS